MVYEHWLTAYSITADSIELIKKYMSSQGFALAFISLGFGSTSCCWTGSNFCN